MLILDALETDEMVALAEEQGIDIIEIIRSAISGKLSVTESVHKLMEHIRTEVGRDWKEIAVLFLMPALMTGLIRLLTAEDGGIRSAALLVARTSCVAMLADVFISMRSIAEKLLDLIAQCADVLTPVMVAAVSLSGSESTALLLTPMTGVCVNIIQHILEKWGVTIASAAAVIAISGNLSVSIRLYRLYDLCRRIVRTGAGGCLAGFVALLSLQGRISSGRDGIAFHTARLAVENMIPVVGGNISDSLETLLTTVNLVRNALGMGISIFIILVCAVPMMRLLAMTFCLRFFAAVAEPLGDDSLTAMLEQISGAIEMLLIVCVAAAVLCVFLIGSCLVAASNVIQ